MQQGQLHAERWGKSSTHRILLTEEDPMHFLRHVEPPHLHPDSGELLYVANLLLTRGSCPKEACNILLIHKQGRMDIKVSPPPSFSCWSNSHSEGHRDALDDCTVDTSEGSAWNEVRQTVKDDDQDLQSIMPEKAIDFSHSQTSLNSQQSMTQSQSFDLTEKFWSWLNNTVEKPFCYIFVPLRFEEFHHLLSVSIQN